MNNAARFWFLASPYTDYIHGHDAAFDLACDARALLIQAGIDVYSPIVHSHHVAKRPGFDPADRKLWLRTETPMRLAACGMILLMAEGWETSKGMRFEELEFYARRLPIVPMQPGVVPVLP